MTRVKVLRRAGMLAVYLALNGGGPSHSIDSTTEDFLRATAQFGDRELAVVRSGGRVVKTPETGIAREMMSVGVTRFQIPFDYYVERARTGDLYRTGPTLLQLGRFSSEPTVEDMKGLTLSPDDLAALAEVDPEAGQSEAAAKLFCVRLVRAYQAEGIRSLEPLRQGSKRLALSREVRALLANSPYLRHYGAHVEEYVAKYPLAEPNGSQEYFAWAKVHIGLKRLIRLTKVTVWEQRNEGRREAVIVTEQLFASRYFQASLQVDHVIADDAGPQAPAMYLVTINRGRCDVLASAVARFLRPLILSRTRASTERALDMAKLTLESEYQRRRTPCIA